MKTETEGLINEIRESLSRGRGRALNSYELELLLQERDTLREANKELIEALEESKLQIEYLHNKFQATGSGNSVLNRIESALLKHRKAE